MNSNIKGPFLKDYKIASDGTKIVPVHYTENDHYYRYGLYIQDSLRAGQLPILHNPDGIAYIRYGAKIDNSYRDDQRHMSVKRIITSIEYRANGKLHRLNSPAMISQWSEAWYENGLQHRFDGPQDILKEYPFNKMWMMYGKVHRFNGPSKYNDSDNKSEWFFLGRKVPDNIIRFNNGIPMRSFDRANILEASLNFDRMYGKILEIIYNTNNIPSEKEIWDIIKENKNEKGI